MGALLTPPRICGVWRGKYNSGVAWKVIQVILERRLEMCDQPMDTVRPRCTRVKPGKGEHNGNYYKLPQIGRMGAIEELS